MKFFLFFISTLLYSQVPTISSITNTVDNNVAVITYNVSATSYGNVYYGLVSGTYLWESQVGYSLGDGTGFLSIPLSGLKAGTTYYYLATARPNPDNDTNICNVSGCGAIEGSFTTPTSSTSPTLPTLVATNVSTEPNTSAYAIVPLVATGAQGECVSSTNVTAPLGYSGTITTGETITQIINNGQMWYGTTFQVPAGTVCNIPSMEPSSGAGYIIPVLAVDPCAGGTTPSCTSGTINSLTHRWIIFETTPTSSPSLPPFGFRIATSFQSSLGTFRAINPQTSFPFQGAYGGMTFQMYGGVHHVRIRNLKHAVDETQSVFWSCWIQMGNGENGAPPPYPSYIVISGNWFHFPARTLTVSNSYPGLMCGINTTMPSQLAIVGNYFDNLFIRPSLTVIQGFYFTDCNGSPCGSASGPVDIENNVMVGMAMNIYTESNGINLPGNQDFTIKHNNLYWPQATLTYAQALNTTFNIIPNREEMEFKSCSRCNINGNFINGMWVGVGTEAIEMISNNKTSDITVRSNIITNSGGGVGISGGRNNQVGDIEQKIAVGNRYNISNNLMYNLGRGPRNTGATGVTSDLFGINSNPNNISITNNTVVGPLLQGGGSGYYPWILFNGGGNNGPIAGFTMQNNILPFGLINTDLTGGGIAVYWNLNVPGVLSHPAILGVNSGIWPVKDYTLWAGSNFGITDGASNEGMQGASVIIGGSGYPNSGNMIFTNCSSSPIATFTASGGVISYVTFSYFGSGCNPATFTITADTSGGGSGATFIPWYGLTTSYTWNTNIIVGTTTNTTDLTDGQVSFYSTTWPSGDVFPTGGSTVNRTIASGLTNYQSNDFRLFSTSYNPIGAIGANIATLKSDQGIVSSVSLTPSNTTAILTYIAPDSKSCSVDIALHGTGNYTSRFSDSGGATSRTINITGLTLATQYDYRLLCYFDQTDAIANFNWSFNSDPSNLNTDGTFTTSGGMTSNTSLNGVYRGVIQ